jgi:hypothetical protein
MIDFAALHINHGKGILLSVLYLGKFRHIPYLSTLIRDAPLLFGASVSIGSKMDVQAKTFLLAI